MNKYLKGFALAWNMLSILPFFKVHDFYKGINGYGVMFYPLVGFLLGALLYGSYTLLSPFFPAAHLGIIIFVLWVILTGALHLDGFADTVDGLFVDKSRSLEVMKDPHNGGMGMLFSGTFLIAKASSLAVFDAFYLLPIVLMLSRLTVVYFIYFSPYVSKNGMSSMAKEELKLWQVFIASLYVLVLLCLFESLFLFLFTLFISFVISAFFTKRYGGFTGDIYGFSIEVIELLLLNVIVAGAV